MPGVHRTFAGTPAGVDLAIDSPPDRLARTRGSIAAGPWTWLRQVHGADVVTVTRPGEHAGAEADAAVTAAPGAVLAIHTADCAGVVLVDDGAAVVGVAHAGWRGLTAGVIEATVDAMGALGAVDIEARVGPHIRARCYEFGLDELDLVAERYGEGVRATTASGTPALDVTAGVRAALDGCGVSLVDEGGCTACEPDRYFSHRARGDRGRHATVVWLT